MTEPKHICAQGMCAKCGCELNGEAAYMEAQDEVWCHSCADNAAEAAWDLHNEFLMSGDTPTFRETYLAAHKQKMELK